MPTTRVTCDRGACPYSLEVSWPGDDPKPPKSLVDAAFARHREGVHGEVVLRDQDGAVIDGETEVAGPRELGGSSPTSWPPGALDPARVEPDRIVSTHPDGSVAETKPVQVDIQTEGDVGDRPNLGEAVLEKTDPNQGDEPKT